jgi:mono/diheme cytochrome c family protein
MLTRKLPCPSCGVGLKIAHDLAAGQRITCPKCGLGFPVPQSNGQESSPKSATAAARKRALSEDREDVHNEVEERPVAAKRRKPPPPEDDGQEEVEERPVRRKRRKFRKKKPSRLPLILGLVIGGIFLAGIAAIAALVILPKLQSEKDPGAVAANNSPTNNSPRGMARMMGGAGPAESPPSTKPEASESSPSGSAAAPPDSGVSDPFAAGKQVFQQSCARCHRIGGGGSSGGGGFGRGRGPDLGAIGRDHDADWLMGFIRDPKSKKPDSRMPQPRLSDEDLRAVAVYLASLK